MMIAGARRSLHGGEPCGDAFDWWHDGPHVRICLVDGLGHGAEAAAAAQCVLAVAAGGMHLPADAVIAAADAAARHTRGAAVTVVSIDASARTLSVAGVGNIRGARFGTQVKRFEGRAGIVGAGGRARTIEVAAWDDGDLLLLWTDGLQAFLQIEQPDLRLKGDPATLATTLLERFATGRDDAGIVCCLLEAGT